MNRIPLLNMRYSLKNGMLWLFIYMVLALLPMLIAVTGDLPEYRTFWIELGVAFGFVGLSLFALQFIFSGRLSRIAPVFGKDNVLNFHRQIGITSFFLFMLHPLTLLLTEPKFIDYFNPSVNFFRAIALSFATVAIILISLTSIWRVTVKLSYEYWRLLHGLLAMAILFIGLVHSLQVAHYLDAMWKKVALGAMMLSALYMVIHTRLVRPWMNKKRPYIITEVKREIGDCWTLFLKADGHSKMEYSPGQFAWITIGPTPFSLQQHPFTFASSARSDTIAFTAKVEGDFTATWQNIPKGTKAWLEGPFGSFTPQRDRHLLLIMGGIGITPAMSMLRTMRDEKGARKAVLIYANTTYEDITFRDELEILSRDLDLEIVHVLQGPHTSWKGEKGIVTSDLLKKYLPENHDNYMFFICGPAPMMDQAGIALFDLEVNWDHIYMERFEIV